MQVCLIKERKKERKNLIFYLLFSLAQMQSIPALTLMASLAVFFVCFVLLFVLFFVLFCFVLFCHLRVVSKGPYSKISDFFKRFLDFGIK